MKNKLNLNEGEVQRILSLHKNAILKESGQKIINEESTVTVKTPELEFEPKGSWTDNPLKIFKGTKFKKSTKIPNALITTRKVSAQFPAYSSAYLSVNYEDNKAFVVYNCSTKNVYLIGSTNEGAAKQNDLKSNKKAIWTTGGSMKSWDKLCNEATVSDEVVVKYEKGNEGSSQYEKEKENKNLNSYNKGVRGNRYAFDYNAIMKAIDDTGKCTGVSGSSDGTNTGTGTGTNAGSGTSGVSGIQTPAPISNKISKELYYKIIAP